MNFTIKFTRSHCHQECVIYLSVNFGKTVQTQYEFYYKLIYWECDGQDYMKVQLTHHLKIETRKNCERCS